MTVWTEGHVAAIDYTHAFYPELSPALLSFALLLKGIKPPVTAGEPFSYCELGCGQGLTSNMLAALYPESQFEAVDIMPTHIEGAEQLAHDSGLDNVAFHQESFAAFAERTGPAFDIIALHGVWSWVDDENRRTLIDVLSKRLKPGGAVYVSYNCLPGWAADMPVRRLLLDGVLDATGLLPERIEGALSFSQRLSRLGGYFDRVPSAALHLNSLSGKTDRYIAHEYLNRDWAPFYHADVASNLTEVGLTYAASATLLDHLDDWRLTPDARNLLDEVADPVRRETLGDYLTFNRFRRDIYTHRENRLSPEEREKHLKALRFGLCVPRSEVPEHITLPNGQDMDLPPIPYAILVDALNAEPQSLSALLDRPELVASGFVNVLEALTALIGLGVAVPVMATGHNAHERCSRINAAILHRNRHSPDIRQLASPVLATGITVDLIDRLFLLAMQEGQNPPAFAWDVLSKRGRRLRRHGEWLESVEDNLAELREIYASFVHERLPYLQKLGVTALKD